MSLSQALIDLKDEVIAGATAEEAVAQVAADNDVNPNLVLRKFRESHPTDDGVRANATACAPRASSDEDIQKEVARQCRRYGVSAAGCKKVLFKGEVYTMIGYTSNKYALAVKHKTADSWKLPAHRIVALKEAA